MKMPYICGPLTELREDSRETVKRFYEDIADVCKKVLGQRAFVPHEQYDPVVHASYTPQQVDAFERRQISELTSLLIVVAVAPSWGGGIEVEIAYRNNIPIIVLCERDKLEQGKVSRLLRGNPGVAEVISYANQQEALQTLDQKLASFT